MYKRYAYAVNPTYINTTYNEELPTLVHRHHFVTFLLHSPIKHDFEYYFEDGPQKFGIQTKCVDNIEKKWLNMVISVINL